MDAKELEVLNQPAPLQPVDENGSVLGPPFSVVHKHLLCLDHVDGEVVILAPHSQFSDLPIGCRVIAGDQAYHYCVISKLNDGFEVVPSRAIMSEQDGTEYAPLKSPLVEDQRCGCVVTYPYHLGAARQEVQDPVAEGGV